MPFCVAGVALCDIPTCLTTCRKSFCVAGTILLCRFHKMSRSYRGRRSTLETSIATLRGRRSTWVAGFTIKHSQFPKHLVSVRCNSCLPHYLAMDSKHVIEGFEDFHVRIDGHNIPVGPMRFEEVRFWNFGIKPTYLNHLVRICRLMSKDEEILLTFAEPAKLWRESKSVRSFCLGSLLC